MSTSIPKTEIAIEEYETSRSLRNRARRAMKRFEKAVRAHEMRGTHTPEEVLAIEDQFQRAKRELASYLQYIS